MISKPVPKKPLPREPFTRPIDLIFPVVAVMGAGATTGGLANTKIPPPVDKDFFDTAALIKGRGTPVVAKRVMKDVFEMFGKVHGVGLEEYYREIETRAAIGAIAPTQNKQRDWGRRKQDLDELIRRIYIHTTFDLKGNRPLKSETHENLFRLLKRDTTIITFNYDLVIEENIQSAGTWNPINGFLAKVSGSTSEWARKWMREKSAKQKRKTSIDLLKMHGSLGWRLYEENKAIRIKDRPYVVRAGQQETVAILGPGWKKPIDRNPFKRFWREARLRIERAKTVMIIGYSLPETDLLARALFAEAIRLKKARNHMLRKLFIVDPSVTVKEKFASLFAPCLGPNGNVDLIENMDKLNHRIQATFSQKEI